LRNRENHLWELQFAVAKEKCKKNLPQLLENAMWQRVGGAHIWPAVAHMCHFPSSFPTTSSHKSSSAFVALQTFQFAFLAVVFYCCTVVFAAAGSRNAKNFTIKLFTICQGQMLDAGQGHAAQQVARF